MRRAIAAQARWGRSPIHGRLPPASQGPARRNNPLCLPENLARATPLIQTLRRIASSHDATPAQVALAWVLRQDAVIAIPKASTESHVRDNARSIDIELDKEDLADLDREFPPPKSKQALPML